MIDDLRLIGELKWEIKELKRELVKKDSRIVELEALVADPIIEIESKRIAELETENNNHCDMIDRKDGRIAELEATRVPDELLSWLIDNSRSWCFENNFTKAESILARRKEQRDAY